MGDFLTHASYPMGIIKVEFKPVFNFIYFFVCWGSRGEDSSKYNFNERDSLNQISHWFD